MAFKDPEYGKIHFSYIQSNGNTSIGIHQRNSEKSIYLSKDDIEALIEFAIEYMEKLA